MRLNQKKPQVFITRSNKGGIVVRSTVKQTNLTHEEIQEIVRSFGIVSATVTLRTNVTDDHIVDTLAGNRVYSNAVVVINKVDLANEKDIQRNIDTLLGTQRVRRIGPEMLQNNESHTELPELPENLKPIIDNL